MNVIKIILLTACTLVIYGCASNNPPAIPAIEVAPEIPYLWPETNKQDYGLNKATNEEFSPDSSLGIENGIIAVVGEKIITLNEFDYEFIQALQQFGTKIDGERLYNNVLNCFINVILFVLS